MSMLDRLTSSIAAAYDSHEFEKTAWLGVARMALAALHEPTSDMIRDAQRRLFCNAEGKEIGEDSLRYWIDNPSPEDAPVRDDLGREAIIAWKAMIESALEGK